MLQGILKMFYSENNKIISSDLRYNITANTYHYGTILPNEIISDDYKVISCCVINDNEIKKNDYCFNIEIKKIIKFSGEENLETLKKVLVLPHQISPYLYSDIFYKKISNDDKVDIESDSDSKIKLRKDGTVSVTKIKL